jgi:hypothetical protein
VAGAQPRRVAEAAAALAENLDTARDLIPHRDTVVPAMISARGTPESRAPWNTPAANAVLDAHAGVRHLENGLRLAVTGSVTVRGGSDGNTREAIAAVVSLAEAAGVHDEDCYRGSCDQCRIVRLLRRWNGPLLRLAAIDVALRWQAIRPGPRAACPDCFSARPCADHARPPACPYCGTYSLRVAPDRYLVACFNEMCEDDEGQIPVARLELSRLNADTLLVWGDGRIQPAA